MHLEQAIKDAVEKGGWRPTLFSLPHLHDISLEKTLLDPAFWQALGKARGWYVMKKNGTRFDEHPARWDKWKVEWHRLIDHLAAGGSVEDFFKTLV